MLSERNDVVVNYTNRVLHRVFFGLFLIFGFCFGGLTSTCAEFEDNTKIISESSETVREFRKGRVSGDILCGERVKIFPEEKFVSNDGQTLFSRTVEIEKEFKKRGKNATKAVASHTSKKKFTYDRKTFVRIDNPDKDIEESETGDAWSVMDVKEIFPQEKNCLVSTRCALYKENKLRIKEYVLSSHYDVTCSIDGQIGVNTELH